MATVISMPRLGLNEDENVLGEWFVSEGDTVKKGDELFSIETDKSSMTIYAEEPGTVLKCFYEAFDVVPVMTPVCVTGEPGEDISGIGSAAEAAPRENAVEEPKPQARAEAAAPQAQEARQAPRQGAVFSPRAKKLAEANGISAGDIAATGAEGRIVEEDVINAMKSMPLAATAAAGQPQGAAPTAQSVAGGNAQKLSSFRRVIARNMMDSMQNTAQTTTQMRYNASKIQNYRAWLKGSPGEERNITLTDLIAFATVKTLQKFPEMNAHMIGMEEIVQFGDVHLGCAVDTEKGLMVPTIKDAQGLSLPELSTMLKKLAQKCRDGAILPDEMSGATFTISNVGSYGVTYFTPILNPPQIGILGVGTIDYAIKKTEEGMLYYPAGYLSLTYDHRAIDGAPAAIFLREVCRSLERFDELLKGEA